MSMFDPATLRERRLRRMRTRMERRYSMISMELLLGHNRLCRIPALASRFPATHAGNLITVLQDMGWLDLSGAADRIIASMPGSRGRRLTSEAQE